MIFLKIRSETLFREIDLEKDYFENKDLIDSKGFRDSLFQFYPQLTQRDLELIFFILEKKTTRQIARFYNITPDSVKKAKHRLRKKMKMNPNISWIEFLFEKGLIKKDYSNR